MSLSEELPARLAMRDKTVFFTFEVRER